MEFMMGMGLGWGLGIAFTCSLAKILWPKEENIWDQHKKVQDRAKLMSEQKKS